MAANKDEKVPDIVTNAVLVQSEQMPENSEICKGKNEWIWPMITYKIFVVLMWIPKSKICFIQSIILNTQKYFIKLLFVIYSQCGNYGILLPPFFCKNSVKSTSC